MFVYVGTFTNGHGGGEDAEGISVFHLNEKTTQMEHVQTVSGLSSPSWLAQHPSLPLLFTAERELSPDQPSVGALTSFAIDPVSGTLTQVDRQPSGGDWPAHLSVHPGGRYVFVANARSAEIAVFPITPDGCIQPPTCVVQHHGSGPVPRRQDTAYVHAVSPDPAGTHVLACDLGLDRVFVYDFDEAAGTLTPARQPFVQVSSGAGPRHLAFHSRLPIVYVLNELDATVSSFAYDPDHAPMTIQQTVRLTPEGYQAKKSGAEIVLSRDGRFLYASSRVHDAIVVFEINQATGELRFVAHEPSEGQIPRNFEIDPSGNLMLVANQVSGTLVRFRIMKLTGRLTRTGQVTRTPSPVSIVFRPEGRPATNVASAS